MIKAHVCDTSLICLQKMAQSTRDKMIKILSINVNSKKGVAKIPIERAELIENYGIQGDAHAENGSKKQVSLLPSEAVLDFKKNHPLSREINNGSFGENITTVGLDFRKIKIGGRLKIGDAVIEISEIGKVCHTMCNIGKSAGECIMPKLGVFARVITGGKIENGYEINLIT